MNAEQLMTQPAITCRPQDSLNDVARLMWEHDIGVVGVAGDDEIIVGMISDRDVSMAAYTQGQPLAALRVENHMSKEVITCRANESVQSAMDKMARARVRRLPVIDGRRRAIGMLSMNDLAREARRQSVRRRPDLTAGELVETLARACEPHARTDIETTAA